MFTLRPLGPHPRHAGFTLVEIMMVVFIIGFLLALAIPNFFQAREVSRARACVANLREIEQAKHQYVLDHNVSTFTAADSTDPTLGGLCPTYVRSFPICQAGGLYATGDYAAGPTCSLSAGNPSQFGPASPFPHSEH